MRFKSQALFVVVLTAFAASFVASASASAEACHKESGSKQFALCIAGVQQGSPTETAVVPFTVHLKTGTSARFTSREGLGGTITCTKATASGEFASGNTEKLAKGSLNLFLGRKLERLQFSGCTMPNRCKVREPFTFKSLEGSFGASAENIALAETAGSEYLAELTVESLECAVRGTYTIKSELGPKRGPECKFREAETEGVEHQLVCEEAKSHMTIVGHPFNWIVEATLELTGASKGQKFSVIESA